MSEASPPAAGQRAGSDTVALTVHGASGALDLLVPNGAAVADVAREYAALCGLARAPGLLTSRGRVLDPAESLERAGIGAGRVLVATHDPLPQGQQPPRPSPDADPDRRAGSARLWFPVAGVLGILAGVAAGQADSAVLHMLTVDLLFATALICLLPFGRFVDERALTAPVFAAAACHALVWEPGETRLLVAVGVAGLAASVAAGVGRALGSGPKVVQHVWIIGGLALFAVAALTLLAGAPPQVAWSVLLALAMLAARWVPALAVDVPDQLLIDLERLAITAWSARERPNGKRGRILIQPEAVSGLLARGGDIVNATGAAVLVVVAVAVPALLDTAVYDLDRQGAWALVFFVGASIQLAARSYRHRLARTLLRTSGVLAWVWLAGVLVTGISSGTALLVVLGCLCLAAIVLVVAVATGRGWRSVWWARRAEIAETLVGVFGLASVVMASSLFRQVWELKSGG